MPLAPVRLAALASGSASPAEVIDAGIAVFQTVTMPQDGTRWG